jgi:hypothetical protein
MHLINVSILLVSASASTQVSIKERILPHTTRDKNPPDCKDSVVAEMEKTISALSEDGSQRGKLSCEIVWISKDDVIGLANKIIATSEDIAGDSMRAKRAKLAEALLDALPEKTLDTAKVLANVFSTRQEGSFEEMCRFKPSRKSSEISPRMILQMLQNAQPTYWAPRAYKNRNQHTKEDNFLLPLVRMLRGLQECERGSKPDPLPKLTWEDYKSKYLPDDEDKGPEDDRESEKSSTQDRNVEEPVPDSPNTDIIGDGDVLIVNNEKTSMDPANQFNLLSDLERKKKMIDALESFYYRTKEIGIDVLEASSRILYISALYEMSDRISQHQREIQRNSGVVEKLIEMTMDAIRGELL